jgi:7,8-dihydropterin-6-yl-methyl-4-(beta-D-ribofuranosyl)aminobenzene 5'-phosphate synthase
MHADNSTSPSTQYEVLSTQYEVLSSQSPSPLAGEGRGEGEFFHPIRPEKRPVTIGQLRILSAAILALLVSPALSCGPAAEQPAKSQPTTRMHDEDDIVVTVVYDNYSCDDRLETAWGFACVIEGLAETILFDTGGEGKLLLANMAKAGFQPKQIECVVLSHIHGDHTGGLADLLKANSKVKVFMPRAFPDDFRKKVAESGARVVETEEPSQVCDGAWTTGVLTHSLGERELHEQGLYLKTPAGLVLMTGCAHPGIVRMAEAASRHAEVPVHTVLGGFHLGRASGDQLGAVIRGLRKIGVQQAAPSHCSGDKARQSMQEAFGDGYLPSGAGARHVFAAPEQKPESE